MRKHNEAVSQGRWPWLEAVNMIEMLSYLGTSELSEQHVTKEIEWVVTGVDDNTFNGVVRAQLSEDNVDQMIDEVARRFQERHAWHLWFLTEDSRPADLAQRLEAHGWVRLQEGVGMALDLSAIAETFPPPPGLTVERVVDEAGLALWGTFHRYLGDHERDEPREWLYRSLGLSGEQPLRHYLARLHREPAGGLSLFLGQEAAGIYNVEVAEHLRRRGVGTAMTRWVLEEARRLGAHVGVLGPTRESRSMYERLGFVLHREIVPMYWYPVESS
ncbi:MAG TPA: GNAT family N-acetyltransferase [Ktedonobacterales bacterium]|nr:GNAT family N-acetyltransferase [Ktedonobacterales bacterium]